MSNTEIDETRTYVLYVFAWNSSVTCCYLTCQVGPTPRGPQWCSPAPWGTAVVVHAGGPPPSQHWSDWPLAAPSLLPLLLRHGLGVLCWCASAGATWNYYTLKAQSNKTDVILGVPESYYKHSETYLPDILKNAGFHLTPVVPQNHSLFFILILMTTTVFHSYTAWESKDLLWAITHTGGSAEQAWSKEPWGPAFLGAPWPWPATRQQHQATDNIISSNHNSSTK